MASPSPNPPAAPSNTPIEQEQASAVQPHYDDLLEVLPSATVNRALGDPTLVPPNSPEFTSEGLSNIPAIASIEEMSLGSSHVRDEKAYTLDNSVQRGEMDTLTEGGVENVTDHEVAVPQMALDEPISPGMSVHLRLRARDVIHLSNSVLSLASALETLTRALNALLHSQEMRARDAEESQAEAQASTAKVVENATIDGEEDQGVKKSENDGADHEGMDEGSPSAST